MIRGKVHKFGKNIDTEVIYPARYMVYFQHDEVAKHVMEDADPEFAKKITKGDIIVAESNFGCGSAREQAATALKYAGIGAVLSDHLARTFYRNAINNCLPAFSVEGISSFVSDGDTLEIDIDKGIVINTDTGKKLNFTAPGNLIRTILEHGAVAHYKKEYIETGK
ncbi:3-isopropylmalate dehydratase small subunit [Treponema primitia]|uniref:LeuD/DmdB family oxidoreductase small subunit n=1 Tax=Treponema primitia TaxID=88058 RepID=UPI00397FFF6C